MTFWSIVGRLKSTWSTYELSFRYYASFMSRRRSALLLNNQSCSLDIGSRGTICMANEKVKAIEEWDPPSKVYKLRSFLGLVNHYRRFIQDFSSRAAPLTNLLKKNRIGRENGKRPLRT